MISFCFLFRCGFQEKIMSSWRNCLIWTTDWGGEHNTPDTQIILIICLSAIAVMRVIFWTKDNFCFISDCRNSFNCKLEKLILSKYLFSIAHEVNFVHLTNLCRWNILSLILSLVCVPFHLIQYANTKFLLIKTHRFLNISSKCAVVRYRKNQLFL